MNGVPLKDKYLTENTFEEGVVSEIMAQTPDIQKAVYNVRYQFHLVKHGYVSVLLN